ncbi:hypothetical protein GCM10009868_40680 [Terrabacter aerolatus]|uniref:Uncharacterized protein n=1 Tax=Terrabacter aerolatus TaxID=422442 RepID=A0A512D696_9MICO|nr:hypothetical protein [Terrabacter aerolatus]GEO32001.1 hypothetical protein TAE01_38110 [Terrabacter aerolatus]
MTEQLTDDLSDTRTGTRVEPAPTPEPDARPRAKLLDLSVTQLIGGSMAAATAAALGSRLGVVGTIAGAAVLSVVSATAASLYTNSMARAKEAVVLVRSRRGVDGAEVAVVTERRWRGWRRPDRPTTRRVLATTAAVFAIAAAFVTGVQLTTGAQVTGTNLGGRTAAGAVVDSPVASRADAAQQGSRAGVAPVPQGSAAAPSTPATTTPATGAGATAAPSSAASSAPAPTGTPATTGAGGATATSGSTVTGTPTAPAGGASTPTAP